MMASKVGIGAKPAIARRKSNIPPSYNPLLTGRPSPPMRGIRTKLYPEVFGSASQVSVEPVQRMLPGLLGCGFVVTRRRVVMEAVIGALVNVTLVRHVCLR